MLIIEVVHQQETQDQKIERLSQRFQVSQTCIADFTISTALIEKIFD